MTEQSLKSAGELHIICGKMASGKSTLAASLKETEGAIVISEDEWLAGLFKTELETLDDYVRCTRNLRAVMQPHLVDLLKSGQTIVLDFAANTKGQRAWMRSIIETANCKHSLHLLDVPDEVCLARLHARNASGNHEFQATEEQFHQFSAYFTPPHEEEGFSIVRYPVPAA